MAWFKSKPKTEDRLAGVPVEQFYDLYWLGFLLTGDRQRSVEAVMETLEMKEVAQPFFQNWLASWARKLFIAKALGK